MAFNLDAILKLTAKVSGGDALSSLGRAINGVGKAADGASRSVQRLGQSAGMGGLAGALGALTPLVSAGGLALMARNALQAGDAMFDMSQKTGVSVEMLSKFKQVAMQNGTTIESVVAVLGRLSRAMVAAASNPFDDFGKQTKEEMDAAVDAIRDGERKQTKIVRDQADARLEILESESDARLKELNRRYRDEARLRDDAREDVDRIESRENDERLENAEKEISRRYDLERDAIDRRFDLQREAINKQKGLSDAQERQLRDSVDDQRKQLLTALEDRKDDELDALRNGFADLETERRRYWEDVWQAEDDAVEDQKAREEAAIRQEIERKKRAIRDKQEAELQAIKESADARAEALKADPAADAMSEQLEELGLSGKGASQIFRDLGVSIKDSTGNLRPSEEVMLDIMTAFKGMEDGARKSDLAIRLAGRGLGMELIPFLNAGREGVESLSATMKTSFAEAAGKYDDDLQELASRLGAFSGQLAEKLLPILERVTGNILGLLDAFSKLDPKVQGVILDIASFAPLLIPVGIAIRGLILLIGGLKIAMAGLAGLRLGATIAGSLGGLAPALKIIGGLMAGLVSWPALIIAGLVLLGIAAWTFRREIAAALGGLWEAMQFVAQAFINWLVGAFANLPASFKAVWDGLKAGFDAVWNAIKAGGAAVTTWWRGFTAGFAQLWTQYVVTPIQTAWNGMITALRNAMTGLANAVRTIWNNITSAIRSAVDFVVGPVIRGIQNLISWADQAIGKLRQVGQEAQRVPIVGGVTQVVQAVQQAFAGGGYVTRPTVAMVGEGGESEYVVPESKMASASASYLAGARGADVLSGRSYGASGTGTTASTLGGQKIIVDIRTGPVMQVNGQQMVTIEDVARVASSAAEGVLLQLQRSPRTRQRLGVM